MALTTASQVTNKLYALLSSSTLKAAVSGNLYKHGLRPLNRVAEDIVINCLTGDAAQIQQGVANVNVFVPDIDGGTGALVCNTLRCRTLEAAAVTWLQSLVDSEGFHFELDEMVNVDRYEDSKQHYINIRLKFRYVTF